MDDRTASSCNRRPDGLGRCCDNYRPVREGPTAPSAESHPLVTYQARGFVVDGNGGLVVGATIAGHSAMGTRVVVQSDADGAYAMTLQLRQRGTSVTVEKPGYEPATHWLLLGHDGGSFSVLRIYQVERITAGESLELYFRDYDDPKCGFELYPCRRIRVTAPSTGTLAFVAIGEEGMEYSVVRAGEEPYRSKGRLRVPVTVPGSEVVVDVAIAAFVEAVTLKTSLESN